MSVRCSRSPRRPRAIAVPLPAPRSLARALAVASLLTWLLAAVVMAQPRTPRTPARPDTLPEVSEVTITSEGIRIERGHDKQVVIDRGGSRRITIDADIDGRETDFNYDHGDDNRIVFLQDVTIGPGETVDGEVVAIFGSVRVDGNVEGQIVSVLGNVQLGDSASAGGDVVAVGGVVRAASATQIRGDTVSVPFFGLPEWQPWVPLALALVFTLLGLLLGALISILFPERLARVAHTISQRTFLSLVVGSATFPLLPLVLILLSITVIGLPVAMVVMVLFPVAQFVGFVAASALLGSRLRGMSGTTQPILPSVILGMAVLGVFFVLSIALITYGLGIVRLAGIAMFSVALLMNSVCVLLGTGALLLSRLGQPAEGEPTPMPSPTGGTIHPAGGLPSPAPGTPVVP